MTVLGRVDRDTMQPMIVSVIIPTRNRPRAIIACLDAIGRQEFAAHAYEVIVVDDGSDDCLQLDPRRWADRFDLCVLRQENAGPAAARQRGVAEARGAILAFTDDDCLPAPGWLATLVAALELFPESMAGGSTFNGLSADVCAETSQLILDIVYEHFNADPSGAYFFASNNIAMRRSDYLASGGFDGEFASPASEDREFCDRWRLQGRPLRWVPSAQVEHRTPRHSGHSPACTTVTAVVHFSTQTVVVTTTQAPWSRTWAFTAPFPGV
jgi:glycosyltransferase involved in cell wall biosynthesis